jgi:hypothetical protein
MAIDIFSIPPMSAEPERVFSGARRTISWTRACLGGSIVEITECLKSWIRQGLADGVFRTEDEIENATQWATEFNLEAKTIREENQHVRYD